MKVSHFLSLIFTLLVASVSSRELTAESLVTCMENSQISASYFDVVFNPDDLSIRYTFDFTSEIDDYIVADIIVYAYGFKIITETIDLCDIGWSQFCPLYPGSIEVDSIEYISSDYADRIPGITYTVPDIDAFARVIVKTTTGEQVGCIQAFFSNGKTVSQTGAKWATAVIAGLGLLSSAIASAFGNSNAASHISANAVSLFLYFQSVVVVAMEHVDSVPPIAAAWAENLAWSMGLIRITFMQNIFRWYIQSTGGSPDLYLTSSTYNILVQRSVDFVSKTVTKLLKRAAPLVLYGNSTVLIFRGIQRMAYNAGIENTSIVVTGFTFFILCAYVLVGIIFVFKYASELFVRVGWIKPSRFVSFRDNWRTVLKGALSRYIFIGFTQLVLLSLLEFYQHDSPAVIVLAVLFLLLALSVIGWTAFRVYSFGQKSIELYKNPAAILYGDQKFLDKYGYFYTMFNANKYWWGIVVVIHAFVKCVFISLCQQSGKTQALVIWIVDMAYLGVLIHFKPYLNTPTNIMSIMIQVVSTLNSFLFTFFSNVYGQDAAVSSIMGWVFFILNAAFSLILLLWILLFCSIILFSKNPDAKFKPATDDRTSFQKNNEKTGFTNGPGSELLALGLTAKDHKNDWQTNIQDLKDKSAGNSTTTNELDEDKVLEDETLTGKIVRKLTGRSLKRNKSNATRPKSTVSIEKRFSTDKRLISGASYLDEDRALRDDDQFSFNNDYNRSTQNLETASVGSFGDVLHVQETSTNDFIGSPIENSNRNSTFANTRNPISNRTSAINNSRDSVNFDENF